MFPGFLFLFKDELGVTAFSDRSPVILPNVLTWAQAVDMVITGVKLELHTNDISETTF